MKDREDQAFMEDSRAVRRWVYEVRLFRTSALLFTVWKVLLVAWLLTSALIFMISLDGVPFLELLGKLGPVLLYTGLFLLALSILAYALYGLIMKGRTTVLFEMDSQGVRHSQLVDQAKKAKKLGNLTAAAGLAAGMPAAAGAGLLAGSRRSSYTAFRKVRAVRVQRRRQTILLRSSFMTHNQVYAASADFDSVLNFIESHLPPDARVRK